MPHQRRHVDVGGLVPQRVQPCAEGLEAEQRRWPHQVQRLRRIGVDQRCDADAAIAGHHGRDSLRHLGLHVRMHQQVAVVMGMGIDEARREHASVRLDDAISAPACQLAHRHDPAAGDRHVRAASRCAGSVDHRGAPEQQLCLRSLACPLVFHAYLLHCVAALAATLHAARRYSAILEHLAPPQHGRPGLCNNRFTLNPASQTMPPSPATPPHSLDALLAAARAVRRAQRPAAKRRAPSARPPQRSAAAVDAQDRGGRRRAAGHAGAPAQHLAMTAGKACGWSSSRPSVAVRSPMRNAHKGWCVKAGPTGCWKPCCRRSTAT